MNVLILDEFAVGLDLAQRLAKFGHEVRWYIPPYPDGGKNTTGDGYFKKLFEWEPSAIWADLIIMCDNVKWMRQLDSLRAKGYPVFGTCLEVAEWEVNRMLGQEVLKQSGVPINEMAEFKNLKEATAYIKDNPGRYVAKPSGDTTDKSLSHVSKTRNSKDLIFMMDHWQKSGVSGEIVLQKFAAGVEMAVGGYFGLAGWVGPWVHNFEFKKLLNGNLGENVGEQGTVVYYTEASELANNVLVPLTAKLIRSRFTGYIDVNCIIEASGSVVPLEFTSRCGWPLEWILNTLTLGDPAEWRLNALNGIDSLKASTDIATGVMLTQRPFPRCAYDKPEVCGYPVEYAEKLKGDFHPICLKKGKGLDNEFNPIDMPVTTGTEIALITGTGKTVCESAENAYNNISKLSFPNSLMYRTDIGERLQDDLTYLKRLGFVSSSIKY